MITHELTAFFVFAERKKNMKPKSKSNRIRDVPEIKNIVRQVRVVFLS